MRHAGSCLATLGLLLGVALGAGACFDDPTANTDSDCALGEEGCSCLQNSTCFGTLTCIQGVCLADNGETAGDGDGDGDPGDGDGDGDPGDGDGDGDPGENVVVDLFTDACSLTATWTSVTTHSAPTAIPCDEVGAAGSGWMVRYPELMLGDESFSKVISIVAPPLLTEQVRGAYNVDDVPDVTALEFRADVLLRCAESDPDCVGRFGFAVAEGVQNGLFQVIEDRDLMSGTNPISITVPLDLLITLSEPSIVLIGERTDESADASPEVLIVSPRLVLP